MDPEGPDGQSVETLEQLSKEAESLVQSQRSRPVHQPKKPKDVFKGVVARDLQPENEKHPLLVKKKPRKREVAPFRGDFVENVKGKENQKGLENQRNPMEVLLLENQDNNQVGNSLSVLFPDKGTIEIQRRWF